jgi:hypothetical protein
MLACCHPLANKSVLVKIIIAREKQHFMKVFTCVSFRLVEIKFLKWLSDVCWEINEKSGTGKE